MQDEVRFVALEGVGELRERLDRVREERLEVVDQLGPPVLRVVLGGQHEV